MTTLSERLGLKRDTGSDAYDVQKLADNWAILDDHPGVKPVLSTALPAWGPDQEGMLVWLMDKQIALAWSGAAWSQPAPRGRLGKDTRSTDLSTSSSTYQVAAQVSVPILGYGRSILLVVDAPRVTNTAGVAGLAIFQGINPLIEWPSGLSASAGQRAAPYSYPTDPPPAGTTLFSFRIRADPSYGGTTTMVAHCSITAIEI